MSCAKEQDSKSTITMNRIQQEVMHAVHERPQRLKTRNKYSETKKKKKDIHVLHELTV